MKIGVVLDQQLQSGGGFQQSISAIRQLRRICSTETSIEVFTSIPSNVAHPQLKGLPVHVVLRGPADRLKVPVLADSSLLINLLAARLGVMSKLEKAMLKRGVDLVYFLSPSAHALSLRKLPYILTVWDLCHRDHPEFPEVSAEGEFDRRERFYRDAFNRSYLTLSDSDALSQRIQFRYGVDPQRLIAMPFQPAGFVGDVDVIGQQAFLKQRRLPSDYLFYPAQFWPHKNHVRLLQALALLREDGLRYSVAFSGGDKGNKAHVEGMAKALGISDQVHFLGFVDEREMKSLYSYCRALVMPTYFGPTNLPPLEAWALGKPVIYSDIGAAQVGDAALCVDPDSATDLADAIRRIYHDNRLGSELIARGKQRLSEIDAIRSGAEKAFLEKLNIFEQRRLCWGTT